MTQKDHIQTALEEYAETTDAILKDYLVDNGVFTEVDAARQNLLEKLDTILDEAVLGDFDEAFDTKFKDEKGNLKEKEFIQLIRDNSDDLDAEEVFGVFDIEEVASYLNLKGYQVIQINNIADQAKLDEFLRKELYPNHNDQLANLFS